jgi:signal transduction histidine kinase
LGCSYGIWNDAGMTLRIVILSPCWQKLWFKIIVIFTVLFILASFYLSRVLRLKKQKVLLENLVVKKTSELKEKNKILEEHQSEIEAQKEDLYQFNASKDKFFSIIAHDLRNPFNSIIGLSQVLLEEIRFPLLNIRLS